MELLARPHDGITFAGAAGHGPASLLCSPRVLLESEGGGMSALRLPQHLADPAHVDSGEAHLRFDLLEELDSAVGHSERTVEATLTALREFDLNERPQEVRGPVLDAAVEEIGRAHV